MGVLPRFMVKHAVIVLNRRGPAAVNDRASPPTAPGRQTHAVICCAMQQCHLHQSPLRADLPVVHGARCSHITEHAGEPLPEYHKHSCHLLFSHPYPAKLLITPTTPPSA